MDAIAGFCHSPCQPQVRHEPASAASQRHVRRKGHCAPPEAGQLRNRSTEDTGSSAAISYRRSEKTTLVIKTQEGDLVRLSFKARDTAAGTIATATDGESELTELTLAAKSSTRLAVFVKGDLNADELAAIQSVVEQAGSLAREFFGGDSEAAFAQAAALEIDGAQLAKVALKMRVREQLAYSAAGFAGTPAVTIGKPAAAAAAGTGPAVATAVSAAAGSEPAGTAAVAPAAVDPAAVPVPATATPAPAPALKPVQDAPETGAPVPSADKQAIDPFAFLASVLGFLSRLIESFELGQAAANPAAAEAVDESTETGLLPTVAGAEADSDASAPADGDSAESSAATANANTTAAGTGTLSLSLKFRIFSSVIASLTISEARAPAAATLTDAVDTIAASTEPPYETVA